MSVTIVEPAQDHAQAIAVICSTGWRQTVAGKFSEEYQLKNTAFWYNEERVKNDIEQGVYSFVALVDSKVVGVIGGGMTAPAVGEVYVFYLDPAYRYQGIGRRLLDALTEQQKAQGAVEQWVSVQEGNKLGLPFYEARGFVYRTKKEETTDTGELQISLRYSRSI
ncbi:GNAT family N-acetyltransferase [Planococcus sp. YIM B11945]|uniref:GNAT family N-acetyltransferase n=1 Tax=Planococcus sp. YIM B11945 TaxID=3435410 RepID=UPI003D7C5AE3